MSPEDLQRLMAVAIGIGHRVAEEEAAEPVILVDYDEAARLLGISRPALEKRVARNRIQGVVRSGRRVQFQLSVLKGMRVSR